MYVCMCVYIYIHTHTHTQCIYIHTHTHIPINYLPDLFFFWQRHTLEYLPMLRAGETVSTLTQSGRWKRRRIPPSASKCPSQLWGLMTLTEGLFWGGCGSGSYNRLVTPLSGISVSTGLFCCLVGLFTGLF